MLRSGIRPPVATRVVLHVLMATDALEGTTPIALIHLNPQESGWLATVDRCLPRCACKLLVCTHIPHCARWTVHDWGCAASR